jgi:hypothetical protein
MEFSTRTPLQKIIGALPIDGNCATVSRRRTLWLLDRRVREVLNVTRSDGGTT